MSYQDEKILKCSEFEELLTDYLDGSLEKPTHKAVAAHALRCPLCHSLLNEVKDALELCREISPPKNFDDASRSQNFDDDRAANGDELPAI